MHIRQTITLFVVIVVGILWSPTMVSAGDAHAWRSLGDGLELARFKVQARASSGDSIITVLRIDPENWELRLLGISQSGEEKGFTAREWSRRKNLVAVINAGMYNTDHRTHIGYMRSGTHVNNGRVVTRDYRSAAAFSPKHDSLAQYHMFDLDEVSIDSANALYDDVVQNIRLIKRPAENRWPDKPERWSEAALGEDSQGRVLFILCQSPYRMHEFNELLLALPLDIVAAQHLEGGPEAQLYVKIGQTELELIGNWNSGFLDRNANWKAWPIPNIIGVVARDRK